VHTSAHITHTPSKNGGAGKAVKVVKPGATMTDFDTLVIVIVELLARVGNLENRVRLLQAYLPPLDDDRDDRARR